MFRADFKAGRINNAVHVIGDAINDQSGFGDALNARAIGIDQMGARFVETVEVVIMKAGPFTQLPVPSFEAFGGFGIGHNLVNTRSDFIHFFIVRVLPSRHHALGCPLGLRQAADASLYASRQIRPAIHHEVLAGHAACLVGGKIFKPALLPTGRGDCFEPFRIGGLIVAHIHRGGGALKNIKRFTAFCEMGDALDAGCAGADDRNAFVLQVGHGRAIGIAAGIVIIPPTGMKSLAFEIA